MKTTLIALGALLFGALASVGLYRHFVPFPHAVMARADAFEPENQDWLYQNASEVFPTRIVSRAETSQPFTTIEGALEGFTFSYEGKTRTLSDMYTDMKTSGMVILHKGNIIHESYGRGADAGTLFTTFSLVKSFTSTLVGFCIKDGLIGDVEDQLDIYLPELARTAYAGVTIRQALQMSSGVRFDGEGWVHMDDTIAFITDSVIKGDKRAYDIAQSFPRIAEPGTKFNYNTAESQVLLELVRRVSGKTAAAYMEEKLWRPLGMDHDAAWILDAAGPGGAEIGGAFFNATLRDWARFGQFIEQNGTWKGQQLLPEDWVTRSTTPDAPHLMPGQVHSNPNRGYAWHWWTYADGGFAASGSNGQTIFIDPANDIVVARSSAWPEGWVEAHDAQSYELYKALGEWATKQQDAM